MGDDISDEEELPKPHELDHTTLVRMARSVLNVIPLEEIITASLTQIQQTAPIRLDYTNHKGEKATRTITPLRVRWGKTEHHPVEQWLLDCYDHDRQAPRTYALDDCDFARLQ